MQGCTRLQEWKSRVMERVYTACLDVLLLILPLVVMTTTYGLISYKLWPRGGASEDAAAARSHRRRDTTNGQYQLPQHSQLTHLAPGLSLYPFDAHCCHMGTAIRDIQVFWRSGMSARVPGCQKLQMTASPCLAQVF